MVGDHDLNSFLLRADPVGAAAAKLEPGMTFGWNRRFSEPNSCALQMSVPIASVLALNGHGLCNKNRSHDLDIY